MTRGGRQHYAGLSDTGRVRTHNEDAVLLSPPLFAVADGLGGHQAGEIASTIAIETLMANSPARADAKSLGRAARSANREILQAAKEGYGREGMGTTLTAAIIEGGRIAVAHVGDSRAYLYHGGQLERITQDHSMVADLIRQGKLTEEESRVHPNRSIITRALGSDPNMYADTYDVDAEIGDKLLLCSDGLTGMLTDTQIAGILGSFRDPESTVHALVDAANAAGGHDNISVVLVDIAQEGEIEPPGRSARLWLSVAVWLFAAAALVFTAGWGVYRYAQSRAYLVSDEGTVSLYRGVQGTLVGMQLNWLEEETTITARALDPVTYARLEQGIQVDNLSAGRSLLAEYRSQIASSTAKEPADSSETPPADAQP